MGTTQLETVPEPKYWHLRTVLSEALDSEFSVGEILPNERDLAARFGVARATLRQALEQLELEGRLQRRRGVGTTVAPPRMGVSVGTAQHAWPGGAQDAWQALDCALEVPPAGVAEALVTGSAEPVHVVRRSRVSHGQPVAAELLYVPVTSVPDLTAIDTPSEAARADDARELDRLPGAPVLVVTTRFFAGGRTAALSVATYRADTCRLTFGASGGVEIHHGPTRHAS